MGIDVFKDWVMEFYCNMHDIGPDSFQSYVRGVYITISPDELGAFLQILCLPILTILFQIQKILFIFRNDVANAICGNLSEWGGDLLYQKELMGDYRQLNIFVNHNIEPRAKPLSSIISNRIFCMLMGHRYQWTFQRSSTMSWFGSTVVLTDRPSLSVAYMQIFD